MRLAYLSVYLCVNLASTLIAAMNAMRYQPTGGTSCVGADHLQFEWNGVVSDRNVGQPYVCHMREEKLCEHTTSEENSTEKG